MGHAVIAVGAAIDHSLITYHFLTTLTTTAAESSPPRSHHMGIFYSKRSRELSELQRQTLCWSPLPPLPPILSLHLLPLSRQARVSSMVSLFPDNHSVLYPRPSRYKNFKVESPDGRLNRRHFSTLYTQIFPDGDPRDWANYVFDVFDENKNGYIDFKEFICALSATSRGSLEEKLKC